MLDTTTRAQLHLSNIETFYGRIMAIRGVSLSVAQGAIVTVLGSNGAGKSTILKTISGVMRPAKGRIEFEGESLIGIDAATIVSRGIAHIPEGRDVFPFMTVRENLMMGAYLRRDKAGIRSDLDMWMETFPVLRERALQPAGLLSGGQQQMLAIARAMMSRPKILLMDEPSLGLSPLLTKQIFEIIRDINSKHGTTILLVEQNAKLALETAHYGYVLEVGRVVLEGETERLMQDDDVKEFYLGAGAHSALEGKRWKRKKMWH